MKGTGRRPLAPETILPVQFFDRPGASGSPEKRLLFAVLMDAIAQLRRGDASDGGEAVRWVAGEIDGATISFADACEVLGFEADGLARGLLSWRARVGVAGTRARDFPRGQHRVTPTGRVRPLAANRVRPDA